MNVRITYPSERIDVFDTSAFVSSVPFDSKNMLTDFEINLNDIEEKGLWLVANYYAAKAECREGSDRHTRRKTLTRLEVPARDGRRGEGSMRRDRRRGDPHRQDLRFGLQHEGIRDRRADEDRGLERRGARADHEAPCVHGSRAEG